MVVVQCWVAKILEIGDQVRPTANAEEAGQPTHKDSFPISTEREESTEFDKNRQWKENSSSRCGFLQLPGYRLPTSVLTRFCAIPCPFSSKFDTEYLKETASPNPCNKKS